MLLAPSRLSWSEEPAAPVAAAAAGKLRRKLSFSRKSSRGSDASLEADSYAREIEFGREPCEVLPSTTETPQPSP